MEINRHGRISAVHLRIFNDRIKFLEVERAIVVPVPFRKIGGEKLPEAGVTLLLIHLRPGFLFGRADLRVENQQ